MGILFNILEWALVIFFVAAATLGISEVMLSRGLDPFLVRIAGVLLITVLLLNGIRRVVSRGERGRKADTSNVEEPKDTRAYMGAVAGFLFLMTVAAKIREKIQSSQQAEEIV